MELVSGGVDTIVAITDAERDELWRLARLLDQMPEQFPPASASDVGGRPGDRYNDDPDAGQHVLEMLLRHGWTEVYQAGEIVYLRRPGKDLGISATLGYVGPGVLRVFTTSTKFEARAYSPFGVYATLEHGGNFRAAARALASDGTGDGGHRDHRPGSTSMGSGESGVDGVKELPPPSDPMRVANRLVADRFAAHGGVPSFGTGAARSGIGGPATGSRRRTGPSIDRLPLHRERRLHQGYRTGSSSSRGPRPGTRSPTSSTRCGL